MSTSSGCTSCTAACLADTRTSLRAAKDYLWEKAANARPALEQVPRFLRFYCCICCHYWRRKSIGVTAAAAEGDAIVQTELSSENNNFVCDSLKGSATERNEGTPIYTLALIEEEFNKSSQTNGVATANPTTSATSPTTVQSTLIDSKGATPTSMKSATYSEKSTASAQSSNSETRLSTAKTGPLGTAESVECSTPTTTLVTTLEGTADEDNEVNSESPAKWVTGDEVLQLEDVVDGTMEMEEELGIGKTEEEEQAIVPLKRNESLVSLQSKTESIKTQLEDSPPVLSRTQSIKSLLIEEIIDEANDSFVVVEEMCLEQEIVESTAAIAELVLESVSSKESSPLKQPENVGEEVWQPVTPISRPQSRSRSPTIAELKTLSRRNSMIKSMELLYERPPSKQDSMDNTTESSSNSSQLNVLKPQHTPLKQKAKTMHFLKSQRRVSPVKQSIKMAQPELFPPTLQGFEKPREGLVKTFDQLDASNWEVIMLGLKSIVRLMRYHSEYLENQMHMVGILLTRSVRNLRSQVARAACQASTELFSLKSKYVEQECDDLVCALLHRTADTNRFLRADATRALESMCDNLTPPKILNILTTKGALHQHALVRTTAAKLLNRLVERLGSEKVFTMPREQRDKFFVTGANLLLEGSLETRNYAKSLFRLLSEQPSYQRLLLEVIPQRTYRNVEKTLKSIR